MADERTFSVLRRVARGDAPWVTWGTISTGTADDLAADAAIDAGLLVEVGSLVALTDTGRMVVALFGGAS